MIDLLVAVQAAPPIIPAWQAYVGFATVLLTLLGLAWRAGRVLVTKGELEGMATKGDLEGMATKGDLEGMATKGDLEGMATKGDLEGMATKGDLEGMATKGDLEGMATKGDLEHAIGALRMENEKAHAAITENVKDNRRGIQAINATISAVGRDVAFLAGRQHERDQREWASPSARAGPDIARDR